MIASKSKVRSVTGLVQELLFWFAICFMVGGVAVGVQAFTVSTINETYEYLKFAGGLGVLSVLLFLATKG